MSECQKESIHRNECFFFLFCYLLQVSNNRIPKPTTASAIVIKNTLDFCLLFQRYMSIIKSKLLNGVCMKVGASNCCLIHNYGEGKSIELLAKAGFDSIDYSFNSCDLLNDKKLFATASDEEFDAYFMNVKKILDKNNIVVGQTHAITGGFNVTTSQEYFDITVRCIRATQILGCEYTVIHPIILPSYKYDQNKDECKKINMAFFTKLIPYLTKYNVKNAFENMWNWDEKANKICPTVCSRPEEIIDYIETLGSDRFVACLDLGHIELTADTGDTVFGAIIKLKKYLKLVHIHDNDGKSDLHLPPFFGKINWQAVAKAFKEANYDGILNFEVEEGYFEKFGKDNLQPCANYLAQSGRFLSALIKNS